MISEGNKFFLISLFLIFMVGEVSAKKPIQFGAVGGSGSYKSKSACEAAEANSCFRVDLCPLDECSPQTFQEPDTSVPPVETITYQEECDDNQNCEDIISSDGFCQDQTDQKRYSDLNGDGQLWAYCFYEAFPLVDIERLVPDQAKIDSKAAEATEQAAKRAAFEQLKAQLVVCARRPVMTDEQQAECVKANSKAHIWFLLNSGEI